MPNTFSATHEGVMGNLRYRFGTLTMTDGSAGSSTGAGFSQVAFAAICPKTANSFSQYPPTNILYNTNVNGDIKAVSAGSGDTYQCFVLGW